MKSKPANFILRLKKQKEDALEYIIDAYMPLVKTIAMKILHNQKRSDIDECINDVFLAVWQNANQFQGEPEDFKKWLSMITKYKTIDRYRQNEKQLVNEQSDAPLEKKAGALQIERELIQKEAKNEILFALSQLEELDRNIFMMKYYLELSNSEIADSLELTKAAVDNRLYRGKKVLATNPKLKERLI
ncbi:MAG: sigma-70 family RNA polymerase sigma factor [Solibacillus sp.]